jgi:hypothetical protein
MIANQHQLQAQDSEQRVSNPQALKTFVNPIVLNPNALDALTCEM